MNNNSNVYPSVSQYIEAILNPKGRFRALRLKARMRGDEAEYTVRKGVVVFDMVDNLNNECQLLCFLGQKAQDLYLNQREVIEAKGYTVYINELYVHFDDNRADYFTVLINSDVLKSAYSFEAVEPTESYEFIEGVAQFQDPNHRGKWGFINPQREVVIEPLWDSLEEFGEGRAVVGLDGMYGLIDKQGMLVVDTIYDSISWDGSFYAYCDMEGLMGVINRNGVVVVPFEYDWVGEFTHSMAIVCRDNKHGYVNQNGELVIDLIYDEATSFNQYGYAKVVLDNEELHINKFSERV